MSLQISAIILGVLLTVASALFPVVTLCIALSCIFVLSNNKYWRAG